MNRFFTRERFGRPQFLAGLLLVAFCAQAVWLVSLQLRARAGGDAQEQAWIGEGWKQWHGHGIAGAPFSEGQPAIATGSPGNGFEVGGFEVEPFDVEHFDVEHSPLLYLVSAAPLLAWPGQNLEADWANYWRWLPHLPFLACGMLLGASLWYVARRLCGNRGGYVALALYCFSPVMIQASASWHTEPEIVAAWGAFGTIFTAIAVAHTLYAPREVVWWNWRRIVLLGISLGLAVGSQFSMIAVAPIALALMLYVAPIRRQAALVIGGAGCVVGLVLLFAAYSLDPRAFWEGMRHASFWGATWRGFAVPGVYRAVLAQIGRACPALAFALPVTLVTYAVWPRTRYFGNTAPLLLAVVFVGLGMAHPHVSGAGFLVGAVPFLLIFVAGVLADLMETRARLLATACVWGVVGAYGLWSLVALAKVGRG